MRNSQHRTRIVVQEVFEPEYRLSIQVVGRLVEQQQIRSLKQQAAECYAATLTARKHVNRHVRIGQLQRVHSLAKLGINIPAIGSINLVLQARHLGHQCIHVAVRVAHLFADFIESIHLSHDVAKGQANVFNYRLVVVQGRLLLQNAHGVTRSKASLTIGDLLQASHNLEQRRLAHAVRAHNANLCAREEAQRHVVQNYLVAMRLTRLVHLVYKLCHINSVFYRLARKLAAGLFYTGVIVACAGTLRPLPNGKTMPCTISQRYRSALASAL